MPGMAVTPRKLLDLVTDALDDGKAEDIKSFDVSTLTSIADFMVVATGRSSRQVKALAERVADAARKRKVKPLGMEGEQTSEWVLVDLGDVIVHVMQPETRAFYQLEKLWDSVPAPRAKPAAKAAPEKPAKPATRGKPPAKAGRAVAGAPKPRACRAQAAQTGVRREGARRGGQACGAQAAQNGVSRDRAGQSCPAASRSSENHP